MNEDARIIIVGRVIYDDHSGIHQQDYIQSAEDDDIPRRLNDANPKMATKIPKNLVNSKLRHNFAVGK